MPANHTRRFYLLAFILSLTLVTLACNLSKDASIWITLKEEDLNRVLENSVTQVKGDNVFLREIDRVDIQKDKIVIFGTFETPDGTTADGSVALGLSTKNGKLQAEIYDVEVAGISANDKRIKHLNDELSRALSEAAEQSKGRVSIDWIEIQEDALKLKVTYKGSEH